MCVCNFLLSPLLLQVQEEKVQLAQQAYDLLNMHHADVEQVG
jgi:hypothetical protein